MGRFVCLLCLLCYVRLRKLRRVLFASPSWFEVSTTTRNTNPWACLWVASLPRLPVCLGHKQAAVMKNLWYRTGKKNKKKKEVLYTTLSDVCCRFSVFPTQPLPSNRNLTTHNKYTTIHNKYTTTTDQHYIQYVQPSSGGRLGNSCRAFLRVILQLRAAPGARLLTLTTAVSWRNAQATRPPQGVQVEQRFAPYTFASLKLLIEKRVIMD